MQANDARTAAFKTSHTTAKDCDSEQYFDGTSDDPADHHCEPCPYGGSCEGLVEWSTIKAQNGFWRIAANASSNTPPKCYHHDECKMFIECLFPPACLGAPNKVLADPSSRIVWNDAANDFNESCNAALGFRKRSRLCQTCAKGYSRTWGSRCVSCGTVDSRDFSGVFLLFALGSCCALILFGFLVALRKKAFTKDATSKNRRKSIHSTMKRILLSHTQLLDTVMHLNVPWPTLLVSILQGLGNFSGSFGDSVNSMECLYAEGSHADFYLATLLVVAVAPFVFVGVLATYWHCGATRSRYLGCGTKVEVHKSLKLRHSDLRTVYEQERSEAALRAASPRQRYQRSNTIVAHEEFQVTATDATIMSSVLFWFSR